MSQADMEKQDEMQVWEFYFWPEFLRYQKDTWRDCQAERNRGTRKIINGEPLGTPTFLRGKGSRDRQRSKEGTTPQLNQNLWDLSGLWHGDFKALQLVLTCSRYREPAVLQVPEKGERLAEHWQTDAALCWRPQRRRQMWGPVRPKHQRCTQKTLPAQASEASPSWSTRTGPTPQPPLHPAGPQSCSCGPWHGPWTTESEFPTSGP